MAVVLPPPIAIVGHMARATMAWDLAEKTESKFMAMDDGSVGPGTNHVRAWQWHVDNNDQDWSIVLEDDAVPVPDFLRESYNALRCAPTPIVSFYLGRSRPAHWQPSIAKVMNHPHLPGAWRDEHWLTAPRLLHHVGVAVKTSLLPLMLDYIPTRHRYGVPVDEAITMWMERLNLQCAYTHPSLVNHNDDVPTTIVHRYSSLSGEDSDRDGDQLPRRAWVTGRRGVWNNDSIKIPTPVNEPAS